MPPFRQQNIAAGRWAVNAARPPYPTQLIYDTAILPDAIVLMKSLLSPTTPRRAYRCNASSRLPIASRLRLAKNALAGRGPCPRDMHLLVPSKTYSVECTSVALCAVASRARTADLSRSPHVERRPPGAPALSTFVHAGLQHDHCRSRPTARRPPARRSDTRQVHASKSETCLGRTRMSLHAQLLCRTRQRIGICGSPAFESDRDRLLSAG